MPCLFNIIRDIYSSLLGEEMRASVVQGRGRLGCFDVGPLTDASTVQGDEHARRLSGRGYVLLHLLREAH